MMRLQAYGGTLYDVPTNTCLMHPGVNNERTFRHALFSANGVTAAAAIKYDASIDPDHVVFHEWVIDMMQVNRGHTIAVEVIEPVQVPVEVRLEFMAFQSMKDWDDVDCFGPLYLPFSWYTCWPEELKQNAIERATALLLMGNALCDGALVALRHLDMQLVTRIIPTYSIDTYVYPYRSQFCCFCRRFAFA
jgi:hypothetical protein